MIKVLLLGLHQGSPHPFASEVLNPLTSSVTLIRTGGNNILVDTGLFPFAEKILAQLQKEGLKPEDINIVVNTHYHLDHTYNNYLFKKADIYTPNAIQRADGSCEIYRIPELRKNPEGIEIMGTAGHVASHCSVVYREKGKNYVIAGDAVREDIIRGKEKSSSFDPDQFKESMNRIFEMGDIIIPGHGRIIEGKLFKELKKLI